MPGKQMQMFVIVAMQVSHSEWKHDCTSGSEYVVSLYPVSLTYTHLPDSLSNKHETSFMLWHHTDIPTNQLSIFLACKLDWLCFHHARPNALSRCALDHSWRNDKSLMPEFATIASWLWYVLHQQRLLSKPLHWCLNITSFKIPKTAPT